MEDAVEQYNEYVSEWNDRFGHLCSAIYVDSQEFESGLVSRVKNLFIGDSMTERQKISTTITLVGDYAGSIQSSRWAKSGELSRRELATLLVQSGERVLSES